jgi:ferredoxin-nitrite reductase
MDDAKIRLYWSACVKGCGIHGAGDLGFLGCKTKHNGATVLGVDIFIGGTLSGEGGEGHLLLKGIVLEHAREYVAELMRQYRQLRTPKESMEHFITRLQARYSNYSIAFLMRWNRLIRSQSLTSLVDFSLSSKGGNHNEADEIFAFGIQLVRSLSGANAYNIAEPFGESSKPFRFSDKSLTPYATLIEKMVEPNPNNRYAVFSEITVALSEIDNGN